MLRDITFALNNYYFSLITLTDWDSMGRVIIQTRGQDFQTLGRAFQTFGWGFSFLVNPEKLGQVFERLGRMFLINGHIKSFG